MARLTNPQKVKQDYFQWLCELIHAGDGEVPYYILAKELHKIEFTWSVPNDDNRAFDGLRLRDEYGQNSQYLDGPCSVLEMLIGLARRMDFELSKPDDDSDYTPKYFWEMIYNLRLIDYDDDQYVVLNRETPVRGVIRTLLDREYCSTGYGGLFPLNYTDVDQRDVELWYQMNAYLEERYGE